MVLYIIQHFDKDHWHFYCMYDSKLTLATGYTRPRPVPVASCNGFYPKALNAIRKLISLKLVLNSRDLKNCRP